MSHTERTRLRRLRLEPGEALRSQLANQLFENDRPVLHVGERVGAFRIVSEIGRGGLGIVYRASRDDGSYEQHVALKVVADGVDAEQAERLLDHERRLLARLQHPGIARLIDGGRTDSGRLWFAMEAIQGQRIDHYCRDHAVSALERLRLFLQVCDAVDYAHAQLVVHRDLKPANILVDDRDQPRLLDFGIAGALDADLVDTGPKGGTPGYASPEQNRGDRAGVGDDVYQLGRLLESLLADATLPRNRRQDFHAIRQRALAEAPGQRYRSVSLLAADVRALLELRPVTATRATRGYRFGRFLQRRRLAMLLTGAAVATLLLLSGMHLHRISQANTDAQLARQRAEQDASSAKAVTEFMVSVFQQADPALHQGRKPDIDTLLTTGTKRIENELHQQPRVRAAILYALSRIHGRLRNDQQSRALAQAALELIGHGAEFNINEQINLKMSVIRHDPEQTLVMLQQTLAQLDADDPETIHSYLYVLMQSLLLHQYQGDYDTALSMIADYERLSARHGIAYEASVIQVHSLILGQLARHDEALVMAERAWQATLEQRGDAHPYTVLGGGDLAMARADAGQFADAHAAADQAIALAVQLYGGDSGGHALWARMRKAFVWLREGEPDKAADALRAVLADSDPLPPGDDPSSVTAADWLGQALFAQGDPAGAEAAWRDAVTRQEQGRKSQQPDFGQRALNLARALAAQGRCEDAGKSLASAREQAGNVLAAHPIHAELATPLPGCSD